MANGALDGDLIVVGSGDPSLMDGDPAARVFDEWAAALRTRGVQRIMGRIVGDNNAFVDEGLGSGWMWDDLPGDDSAAVGALQFNENAVRITISPGPAAGDAAGVVVVPATSALVVRNALKTERHRARAHRRAATAGPRRARSPRIDSAGRRPRRPGRVGRQPDAVLRLALRNALIARGIDVAERPSTSTTSTTRCRRPSAPRSSPFIGAALDAGDPADEISQNLYAETFLTSLSATAPASGAAGAATARTVLSPWGVGEGGLILRDGSGLTRYDFVTPDALVTISRPRAPGRTAERPVRGVAADRRARRHLVRSHEGHAGGGQRSRQDRSIPASERCRGMRRRPTESRSCLRSSPTSSKPPPTS